MKSVFKSALTEQHSQHADYLLRETKRDQRSVFVAGAISVALLCAVPDSAFRDEVSRFVPGSLIESSVDEIKDIVWKSTLR